MRTLLFWVSMTIAVRHLRFSSSFSLLSQSFNFRFGSVGTHVTKFQTHSSLFQKKNSFKSLLQKHRQYRTVTSMTGVVLQDENKTMGNGEIGVSKASAKIVPCTELKACGERLRQGGLVAFPTETVYGLGCNALDESAIIKVFEAKERPLTDPLISHVTDSQVAFDLWAAETDSLEEKALRSLTEEFWPGPLTMVAKAAPDVPSILMANTGFCACRSPQHPISIALINAAQVPIAAPSANKFGHVSPTRSSHVWHDLQHEDVWIVEEEQEEDNLKTSCCEVGVESSVAKIEMTDDKKGQITLLRQGAVSLRDIEECLEKAGLANNFEVLALTKKATDETVANVAPGQTIRHYSPDVPSFILSTSLYSTATSSPATESDKEYLSKSVLIDFGGKIKEWKDLALAYRDLSETGNSAEATKQVFEILRWAEKVQLAEYILFPEIADTIELPTNESSSPDALTLALKDRLTRAASGIVIDSLGK
uniref:Threonylcarbamoyl-AMP synthase n=1 Tax=Pseudo-nitzschia delicatissima TaxID=44447 RepID=A0A7S0UHB4_9STRA|mmetsp:Transcript_4391/g.9160  ORF Transcript_4391/g.9160 Transcript_4391/m.9160 type:complete len:480 (+) Transcript_4391:40-1479(+)